MRKLLAFVVALFVLGIMVSFLLTVVSMIVSVIGALLIAVLVIRVIEMPRGYALLILFLAMGITLELKPEMPNKTIYIVSAWCIFLLGIYLLIKRGNKNRLKGNKSY
jgi:hypothetical protein